MDTRAAVAADLERLIRAHEPDNDGDCGCCKASGDIVRYPCEPRLICERAAVALARRRARAGGTIYEQNRPRHPIEGETIMKNEGAVWKRSSRCDNSGGNCVEVAALPGGAAVRDSKDPDGAVLVYARNEWVAFIEGVKRGEFDHD